MADPERDDKVSAAYGALGGEEPARALDDAILAAARRKASRWRVPLSVAAMLMLAVGVALRVQQDRTDVEPVALAPQVIETARPTAAPQPAADAALAPRAPAPAAAGAAAESRLRAELAAKPATSELAPDAWLARIAQLRKAGRVREADASLAEFRKRYPGYKIPENLR